MMGGRTLYCDGVIFALIDNDQLYIKVDAATLPQFLAAGSSLFAPYKDQPGKTMNYARLPDDAMDGRAAMLAWATLGVEAGMRAKAKKPAATTRVTKRKVVNTRPTKQSNKQTKAKPERKLAPKPKSKAT